MPVAPPARRPIECSPRADSYRPINDAALVCQQTRQACLDRRSPPSPLKSKIYPPQKYVSVAAQTVLTAQGSILARVALTDYRGQIILDTLVRPIQPVTDYGTLSPLEQQQLSYAPTLNTVRNQIVGLLQDKIIVGYALWNFLHHVGIAHSTFSTRDCATFLPFLRTLRATQMPPLGVLVNRLLGRNFGIHGEHPLEAARAALDLFRSTESAWEGLIDQGQWPNTLPPSTYQNYFT